MPIDEKRYSLPLQRLICHGRANGKEFDIIESSSAAPPLPLSSPAAFSVHVGMWTLWAVYIVLRIRWCWDYVDLGKGIVSCLDIWLPVLCEVAFALPSISGTIEITMSLFVPRAPNGGERPRLKLISKEAPMVHVLVTACGEATDIIMDTTVGAAMQTYPAHCFQVFVLDDGNDRRLKKVIDLFNKSQARREGSHAGRKVLPVVYLARQKRPGVPHFYKSGNLRFGIETTHAEYGSSEFIAALDADMIPTSDWLARVVPHFLRDGYRSDRLGLLGPPQEPYNILEDDALSQDSALFQRIQEPIRDRFGSSQCSGSGYVMRRAAIDSIGGWPRANVGEDLVCTLMLNKAGWDTGYIAEELQYGLAPDSFHSYISQRLRWTAGSLLYAQRLRPILASMSSAVHLSPSQRLFALLQSLKTYISLANAIPMILVPFYLIPLQVIAQRSGAIPEKTSTGAGHWGIRVAFVLYWVAARAWKTLVVGHVGRANLSTSTANRYWTMPYHVYCIMKSYVSDVEKTRFKVSGTVSSRADERSAMRRQPLFRRMANPLIVMHLLYALALFISFCAWVITLARLSAQGPRKSIPIYMHTNLMLCMLELVTAAIVPVRYMMFPPTVPERHGLLERDQMGSWRARKKGWTKRDSALFGRKAMMEACIILFLNWRI
ncbi:nucleotide-diphospho-sugar transferase [Xylariomycetidae sp. FL2044]|nr:nucleotide-diphospho-sugar transferase [Xylariomycetidae sp. FL2044]